MCSKKNQPSYSAVALPLTLVILLSTTTGPADAENYGLTYDRETGRLSVSIEAVAADKLLRELGALAGVRVRVRGEVGEVSAQYFADMPLDAAILRLFRSDERGLLMFYENQPDGDRVAEVRLSGRSSHAVPTPPGAQQVSEAEPLSGAELVTVALPPPPPHIPPPPPPPRQAFR